MVLSSQARLERSRPLSMGQRKWLGMGKARSMSDRMARNGGVGRSDVSFRSVPSPLTLECSRVLFDTRSLHPVPNQLQMGFCAPLFLALPFLLPHLWTLANTSATLACHRRLSVEHRNATSATALYASGLMPHIALMSSLQPCYLPSLPYCSHL